MRRHVHGEAPAWYGAQRVSNRSRRAALKRGDLVLVEANDIIPADGEVSEGVASVNESAVTGESAPVLREAGGDFSAVTGGTRVLSDWLVVRVTNREGEGFLDRMIAMVEGAQRAPHAQRDRARDPARDDDAGVPARDRDAGAVLAVRGHELGRWLGGHDHRAGRAARVPHSHDHRRPAVGHRHRGHGSDGARQRDRHVRPRGRSRRRRGRAAARQDRHDHARRSQCDGVPSRRRASTCASSRTRRNSPPWRTRPRRVVRSSCSPSSNSSCAAATCRARAHTFHKFSAQTRMSGVDLDGRRIRKGAADAIRKFVESAGGSWPAAVSETVDVDRAARRHAAGGCRWTRACSARSSCATSSRAASASASRSCGRWASRPSWSRATTGSPRRPSRPKRASMNSSPRPRRKPSSSSSAGTRRKVTWSRCAATAPTTRRRSRRPTSPSR